MGEFVKTLILQGFVADFGVKVVDLNCQKTLKWLILRCLLEYSDEYDLS